jgi:glycolate oxidase
MRQAVKDGLPVVPAGGGTGYSGGVTSPNGGIILDMRRMNRVLDVDRNLLLVRAEAGITISELNQYLDSFGMWWPHDPGSRAMATLGGAISVRGVGTYFTRYGAAPDMVYGLTVVLSDGTLLCLDPRSKSRVTGYDLLSLLVSAEGTLGIVTEAVLKIWPQPEFREVRLIAFRSLEEVEAYVRALLEEGVTPETFLVESKERLTHEFEWQNISPDRLQSDLADALWIVIFSFAGRQFSVAPAVARATAMAEALGGRPVHDVAVMQAYWERKTKKLTTERTTIPSYHVADFGMPGPDFRNLERIYSETTALFHLRRKGIRFYVAWPTGDLVCSAQVFYDETDVSSTRRALEWNKTVAYEVAKHGGTISAILGIGVRLAEVLEVERTPTELEVMRKLKAVFDPIGMMNPGKLLP